MNTLLEPVILREGDYTEDDLKMFLSTNKIWKESDVYEAQLREYFEITHPDLIFAPDYKTRVEEFLEQESVSGEAQTKGDWIYFPWSGVLTHMIAEKKYYALRTNRNKNVIREEEQEKLKNSCIGIVGLSVGSNVASALAYCGIGNTFKLAEFDTLETTNLNRIRGRVDQIGMRKIDVTAAQVFEVDPYSTIIPFTEGIDKKTLDIFVTSSPKPRVIFEIIDSFEMKVHLRSLARLHKIPVIMVTNLGDRVLLDVERYDTEEHVEFFNGRAGNVPADMLERPDITTADKHRYAVELAGVEHIPQRALDSVKEIGKTLVGRPQLASTVTIAAGFSAYLTKKIILDPSFSGGSWLINFDGIFTQEQKIEKKIQ
jgi:hypothetical protein